MLSPESSGLYLLNFMFVCDTYVRITNYETATYFVKKPRPDESHLDFSSGHFGMEVKELDMLVFNQKVAHGQHRIHDNAHCWTFFVSLVEIDDLD